MLLCKISFVLHSLFDTFSCFSLFLSFFWCVFFPLCLRIESAILYRFGSSLQFCEMSQLHEIIAQEYAKNEQAFKAQFDRTSETFHRGDPTPVSVGMLHCRIILCSLSIEARVFLFPLFISQITQINYQSNDFCVGGSKVPEGMEEHKDWQSLPIVSVSSSSCCCCSSSLVLLVIVLLII